MIAERARSGQSEVHGLARFKTSGQEATLRKEGLVRRYPGRGYYVTAKG